MVACILGPLWPIAAQDREAWRRTEASFVLAASARWRRASGAAGCIFLAAAMDGSHQCTATLCLVSCCPLSAFVPRRASTPLVRLV